MKSREKMRRFLEHEDKDWIPNGLGGCETAGLHVVAYDRLKRLLGVDDPRNRIGTFMTNAIFEPSVIHAMHGDMILLGTRMCPSQFWGDDVMSEWRDVRIWDIDLQIADKWNIHQDEDGVWWGGTSSPASTTYRATCRKDTFER